MKENAMTAKDTIEAARFIKTGVEHAALLSRLQKTCYLPQGEKHWSTESFLQTLTRGDIHAAILMCHDDPIGFYVVSVQTDQAEILSLGIIPTHQRKGFGRYMMMHILSLQKSTPIKSFFLDVRSDNMAAIALYEKVGFTPCGRRKAYYTLLDNSEVDAILMKMPVCDG